MKLIKNVTVSNPSGKDIKVDVEVWGRPRSEFSVWLIRYKGRRITPLEQRLRGWKFSLNGLFAITYDGVESLIYNSNPLMKLIPKYES